MTRKLAEWHSEHVQTAKLRTTDGLWRQCSTRSGRVEVQFPWIWNPLGNVGLIQLENSLAPSRAKSRACCFGLSRLRPRDSSSLLARRALRRGQPEGCLREGGQVAREYRRITFSNAELREALESCPGKKVDKIPPGHIVSVSSIRKSDRMLFVLNIFDYRKQKPSTFEIAPEDVQTALISHCVSSNIPLPRNSDKTVRSVGDNLCLDIINFEFEDVG